MFALADTPAKGHGCLPRDGLEHVLEVTLGGKSEGVGNVPQALPGELQKPLGFKYLLL